MSYTINDMIAYLDGTFEMPTVEEALKLEQGIIDILRSQLTAQSVVVAGKPLEPFNDDAIGHAIRVLVPLQREVDELRLLVNNVTQPENIAGYQEQLRLKEEELAWVKQGLRELKERHKLHLQNKLHGIDLDIEHPQTDAFDLQELRDLRARVVRKIEMLDTELKSL